MRIAVVGAGWAGLSAAVHARQAGHAVTLFDASAQAGGRARHLRIQLPDGQACTVDNGQHILIGAYRDSLALMRRVGAPVDTGLLRLPLSLLFPNGDGLRLPNVPVPFDVLIGIARARGWSVADKASLLGAALRWQIGGFRCPPERSVRDLCRTIRPAVMEQLIEPLCVSALNTPAHEASGSVFLRVLRDSLLGGRGASHLLLPRTDLTQLLAEPALVWLRQHGATVALGNPVQRLTPSALGWHLGTRSPNEAESGDQNPAAFGAPFDRVLWATSASVAARQMAQSAAALPEKLQADLTAWAAVAANLRYEAITTVYLWAPGTRLPTPLLALPSGPGRSTAPTPAQFVFDRGQLGGPTGLLAMVVSASATDRAQLEADVQAQAALQLAPWLGTTPLQVVQTVVEKRATFACTPGLQRPTATIAPGLIACGDYVAGPYPATLEGAVRSGMQAAQAVD